jgi:methyl-accepting chemotaxis protein
MMTIGTRITSTFVLLLACLVLVAGVSLYTSKETQSALNSITTDSLPGIYEIGLLDTDVGHLRALTLMEIAAPTEEKKAPFRDEIDQREREFRETMGRYEKTITTPEDRALFAPIGPAFERYRDAIQRTLSLSDASQREQAEELYVGEGRPAVLKLMKTIDAEVAFNKTNGDRNAQRADEAIERSQWLTGILLLLSLAAGGAALVSIVLKVNRTLRRAVMDLSVSSQQVYSAASQIAASSQSLAQGASEQSASLQQVSASGEEISAMTASSAEKSRGAAQSMAESFQQIGQANTTLEEMLKSMQEINSSSQKISKIIKVIDEIAFQTNILALNAAVEAARAGEAGAGFAVVADEVRSLAQRCAQAAGDTAALIEDSISKTHEGTLKVDRVANVIHSLTTSSSSIKTLVEEVSSSSEQQAHGVAQIAQAVLQMQQVTQKAAAGAEESASAGEELTAQSASLDTIVQRLATLVGVRNEDSLSAR